jgi:hypothetical protein
MKVEQSQLELNFLDFGQYNHYNDNRDFSAHTHKYV